MSHEAEKTNPDDIYAFGTPAGQELVLACSQAGRVVYQSGGLTLRLEEDLTGRNLNDFIADRLAASVVGHAQQGVPFAFEALVCGQLFACRSENNGEHIHIALSPLSERGSAFINTNSAAFISRELNETLSLMFAALATLKEEPLSPAGARGGGLMRQNMFRLLRLSRNLLDCALATSGELTLHTTEEDLVHLCTEFGARIAPVMTQIGATFILDLPDAPVLCTVDRDKLERMLYNLLSNSIIALGDRRVITLSLAEKEQMITLTMVDHGHGMSWDILPRALRKHSDMNPGSPAGQGGAGFGLALVDALAHRHGGSFVVTTRPDQGTLACITLPRTKSPGTGSLSSLNPDYAGGLDRTLIELSTALGREFYM